MGIHDEIARLEKLQKLAEKVHQEAKVTDSKLDDIEAWIEEEAKRVDHLHPKDAKNNCDQIERELQRIDEEVIKQMFNDVKVLRDNRYSQANELHRRIRRIQDRWVLISQKVPKEIEYLSITNTKSTKTVIEMTAIQNTNPNFKQIQECIDFVIRQLKQVK